MARGARGTAGLEWKPANMDTIREVLERKRAVHLKWEGRGDEPILDMQTANMLVTVYDALNADNKITFERQVMASPGHFLRLVDIGWHLVKVKVKE